MLKDRRAREKGGDLFQLQVSPRLMRRGFPSRDVGAFRRVRGDQRAATCARKGSSKQIEHVSACLPSELAPPVAVRCPLVGDAADPIDDIHAPNQIERQIGNRATIDMHRPAAAVVGDGAVSLGFA